MIAQDGYELILGSSIDPQFGPVLLFGTGGYLVEVAAVEKNKERGKLSDQKHSQNARTHSCNSLSRLAFCAMSGILIGIVAAKP